VFGICAGSPHCPDPFSSTIPPTCLSGFSCLGNTFRKSHISVGNSSQTSCIFAPNECRIFTIYFAYTMNIYAKFFRHLFALYTIINRLKKHWNLCGTGGNGYFNPLLCPEIGWNNANELLNAPVFYNPVFYRLSLIFWIHFPEYLYIRQAGLI